MIADKIQKIKRWLRWKTSNLGEYCNNHPYDEVAYGLYLILIDILYENN